MAASMRRLFAQKSNCLGLKSLLDDLSSTPAYNYVPVLFNTNSSKHYDLKWRVKRREKTAYYPKDRDQRMKLQEKIANNHNIQSYQSQRSPQFQITLQESRMVFDRFVPIEYVDNSIMTNVEKVYTRVSNTKVKVNQMRAKRQIKKYEPNFNMKTIGDELVEIYIEAHNLLPKYRANMQRFTDLVTTHCLEKMSHLTALRTIRWQYNEALERPKVVNVSCQPGYVEGNYIAQVTLRMHSKQTLAIYDQFGRIMYGNENHPTNVLEFIVFEKNISDLYGRWKVHDKVVPKWLTLKQELHNSKRITDDEARAFEDIMEEEAQKQKEEEKAKKKAEKKAEKEAEKIRNLKKMRTV
ncbi:39S ribosomal protein L45, mitochondrial-like [Mya arenaria]|uniref:39S ribosomal protein L45, mitochondrial-like n=1 Tax=Mya arenaria TaxID=6604 RepID=UPI0022E0458A|nr:39S ribosomal protein L45, mitochondrial-like [Mya arenaria]